MSALLLKLLTLMALLLMPFGMGAAGAAPVHHAPATATSGHCDEPAGQPAEHCPDQAVDCATACSMLATAEARSDEAVPSLHLQIDRPLAARSTAVHPDIATPPPKRS